MDLSLRERFARLGQIRDVARVSSGSPAVILLCLPHEQASPKVVDATIALARRGLGLLRAKRAVEELIAKSRAYIELPQVEHVGALIEELNDAGIAAATVEPPRKVNVRHLRESLRLSREQFAIRYGFEVETVRNWENGRREPDTTARSYLRVIENDPDRVEEAYAPTPRLGS